MIWHLRSFSLALRDDEFELLRGLHITLKCLLFYDRCSFSFLVFVGAFYTGVPVQAVALKYPNRLVSEAQLTDQSVQILMCYNTREIILTTE